MPMRYYIAVIISAVFVAITGCGKPASDELTIGHTPDGDELVVLTESLRQIGNKAIIVQLLLHSDEVIAEQERVISIGEPNPVVAQRFLVIFDCSQRTFEYPEHSWLFRNGRTQQMEAQSSQPVGRGSPIEKTMNYACMSRWRRWLFEITK